MKRIALVVCCVASAFVGVALDRAYLRLAKPPALAVDEERSGIDAANFVVTVRLGDRREPLRCMGMARGAGTSSEVLTLGTNKTLSVFNVFGCSWDYSTPDQIEAERRGRRLASAK